MYSLNEKGKMSLSLSRLFGFHSWLHLLLDGQLYISKNFTWVEFSVAVFSSMKWG